MRGCSFSIDVNDLKDNYLDSTTKASEFGPFCHFGTCPGLMCIWPLNTNSVYISNPITRESRNIEFPSSYAQFPRLIMGNGFSFVPSIHDYKLVVLCQILCNGSAQSVVHVFSLRDVSLNEGLYWVASNIPKPIHSSSFDHIQIRSDHRKICKDSESKTTEQRQLGCYHSTSISTGLIYKNTLCVCQLCGHTRSGASFVRVWRLEQEYGEWKVLLIGLQSQIERSLPMWLGFAYLEAMI
ncbi:hypothetical protein Cgig2_028365 [Carnegiea gigantea]|uniref:F-box protein n=1 Tax=Carnegiea gigantea TaxID=171969 RepID=A0A9Q1QB45_9CARY|nr:hypothetical protein Cgig2_028365 [Carnegiea gigantea]